MSLDQQAEPTRLPTACTQPAELNFQAVTNRGLCGQMFTATRATEPCRLPRGSIGEISAACSLYLPLTPARPSAVSAVANRDYFDRRPKTKLPCSAPSAPGASPRERLASVCAGALDAGPANVQGIYHDPAVCPSALRAQLSGGQPILLRPQPQPQRMSRHSTARVRTMSTGSHGTSRRLCRRDGRPQRLNAVRRSASATASAPLREMLCRSQCGGTSDGGSSGAGRRGVLAGGGEVCSPKPRVMCRQTLTLAPPLRSLETHQRLVMWLTASFSDAAGGVSCRASSRRARCTWETIWERSPTGSGCRTSTVRGALCRGACKCGSGLSAQLAVGKHSCRGGARQSKYVIALLFATVVLRRFDTGDNTARPAPHATPAARRRHVLHDRGPARHHDAARAAGAAGRHAAHRGAVPGGRHRPGACVGVCAEPRAGTLGARVAAAMLHARRLAAQDDPVQGKVQETGAQRGNWLLGADTVCDLRMRQGISTIHKTM